jgi:Carboxypeptidase regulatory-like domain
VDATNINTKISQSAQTDEAGLYVFPSLVAGTYDIRIEHPGFRSTEESEWPAAAIRRPLPEASVPLYVSRYRFYVHTGKVDAAMVEAVWHDYAEPPQVRTVGAK